MSCSGGLSSASLVQDCIDERDHARLLFGERALVLDHGVDEALSFDRDGPSYCDHAKDDVANVLIVEQRGGLLARLGGDVDGVVEGLIAGLELLGEDLEQLLADLLL